ncbi:hypothetical protein PHMEG_00024142 [Phytophthora megakarya]|uniref:Uncharacterized protein n=1 Tax=Phytophthora megakarya TaxID=4795 RepID=A0A225VF73_9STRA|nr:hypothetical protein PHMEG_00024142 [Phytophthora megakarya]
MFPQIQFTKSTTRRTGQRPSRKAVIEDLRRQVINLTKTLQNLRQRTKNATEHNFHQCPSATNLQDKVWEQIAARQLRQRQKSESENIRLRCILQYQKRVRKNFKRLFRRRCDDKVRSVDFELCAEETHHTNSMIKTIIGYTCTAANASVYVKEMRVARKYVEQTQVLFVCRAVSLIVGKSGNPYGLRIEETMVISVKKADGLTTANETAVVNTYLCAARYDNGEKKTIPFRNKSFVDIAVKGWDCKLTLLNQRIENILFDEAVSAARNQKYPT